MGYDMYMVNKRGMKRGNYYFRANIWGMQYLRKVMEVAGVLDCEVDHPDFQDVTQEEMDADGDVFDKKNREVLSFRSPIEGRVPIVKFGSNDGWIVTPEESLAIADSLTKLVNNNKNVPRQYDWDPGDDISFAVEFSDYCRRAAKRGGFRVF